MRPLRLLILLTIIVIAISIPFYIPYFAHAWFKPHSPTSAQARFRSFFTFHSPLFPLSAIISLTDDNSTFFLARPAAFGPTLPDDGLSGELWIGRGFRGDSLSDITVNNQVDTEMGCSDVPGWEDRSVIFMKRSSTTTGPSLSNPPGDNQKETSDMAGKVVLLSRGGCGFLDKVKWAQQRDAAAVIVGDSIPGNPLLTMYANGDTSNITIPALFTSYTTAHLLSSLARSEGQLLLPPNDSSRLLGLTTSAISPQANTIPSNEIQPSTANWLSAFLACIDLRPVKKPLSHSDQARGMKPSTQPVSASSFHEQEIPQFTNFAHSGLWVTLSPTAMSASPFLDTLLVLVVSPLVTLSLVYTLLLVRSRIRRRRWRAPKSVVDRLPVRTYYTIPSGASTQSIATPNPSQSGPNTPLLTSTVISRSTHERLANSQGSLINPSGQSSDALIPTENIEDDASLTESEKREKGLAEWRRKYGGRQRECVVCLEEYVDGVSQVMSLPCGHEFHVECITPWLTTRRRTCPICKGDVVRSLQRTERRSSERARLDALDSDIESEAGISIDDDEPDSTIPSENGQGPSLHTRARRAWRDLTATATDTADWAREGFLRHWRAYQERERQRRDRGDRDD